MKANKLQKQSWFGRFVSRGGLTLCFTIAVAPFIIHAFHSWWGFDWFFTALLGALVSVIVGHLMLFPFVLIPLAVWGTFFHRGRCPNCQHRGLKGVRIHGDPAVHNGDARDYFFSECEYCDHQFHGFDDGLLIHIKPSDPRYITAI